MCDEQGNLKRTLTHAALQGFLVRVYSVLLVKGDEVSHVYIGTGELLSGLSSVFKSMHWRIHPRKHIGALAIESSVVFLNIAWNLTWLPVEYHSLGKCHTPYLHMGLHLKTKACHFTEGSIGLIFCIGFYIQCHSFRHFAHPHCEQASVSSYCVNKPRPWSQPRALLGAQLPHKTNATCCIQLNISICSWNLWVLTPCLTKGKNVFPCSRPYITIQGEWWTKTP